MNRRAFLGLAGSALGAVVSGAMPVASLAADVSPLTIPTILHLMMNTAPRFKANNAAVSNAGNLVKRLFASNETTVHGKSVNAVWKVAGVAFSIESTDTPSYTDEDIHARDNIVPGNCDPKEEHLELFRALQEKFGRPDFRGLQLYVWWNIAAGVGCGVSNRPLAPFGRSGGQTRPGAIFVDSVGLLSPGRPALLVAHEIGHYLGLQHTDPSVDFKSGRLMYPRFPGPKLTPDEVQAARTAAEQLIAGHH